MVTAVCSNSIVRLRLYRGKKKKKKMLLRSFEMVTKVPDDIYRGLMAAFFNHSKMTIVLKSLALSPD